MEKDPIKAANHYLAEGRRLVRGGDYTEGMAMFDSGLLRLNSARRLVSTPERREGRNEHYGANLEEGADISLVGGIGRGLVNTLCLKSAHVHG